MDIESVIYSRQRSFKLSSDFFDPQCSLLSILPDLHAQSESLKAFKLPDSETSVRIASHAQ